MATTLPSPNSATANEHDSSPDGNPSICAPISGINKHFA